MADALFREVPEDDEEDEEEQGEDKEEDEDEDEDEGYSEWRPPWSPKSIYPARLQADFFVGRQNSITFPRCCGGIHFTRFENLVGM